MDDTKAHISQTVREERQRQRLSIRHLAEKAGVDKTNVVRVESGAANYTIDTLLTIIDTLGLRLRIS